MGGRSAQGRRDQAGKAVKTANEGMKVFEFRIAVDPSWEAETFARSLEAVMHGVFGITELQADGFGRLLPKGFAEVYLSEPQFAEVFAALETGEVK
jgi:hypothetical protein